MVKIIKKYKNRRLYDTEKSSYVTLEALKEDVLAGLFFQVHDAKTGEDLTANVLLQILVEMENATSPFLSPDLLRQLIQFASHPQQQQWKKMLEQSVSMLDELLKNNSYLKNYQDNLDSMTKKYRDFMNQWLI